MGAISAVFKNNGLNQTCTDSPDQVPLVSYRLKKPCGAEPHTLRKVGVASSEPGKSQFESEIRRHGVVMRAGASVQGFDAVQAMEPPYSISQSSVVVTEGVGAYGTPSLPVDEGNKLIRVHCAIRYLVKAENEQVSLEGQEFHTDQHQKVMPAGQLFRKPPHSHVLVIGDAQPVKACRLSAEDCLTDRKGTVVGKFF